MGSVFVNGVEQARAGQTEGPPRPFPVTVADLIRRAALDAPACPAHDEGTRAGIEPTQAWLGAAAFNCGACVDRVLLSIVDEVCSDSARASLARLGLTR